MAKTPTRLQGSQQLFPRGRQLQESGFGRILEINDNLNRLITLTTVNTLSLLLVLFSLNYDHSLVPQYFRSVLGPCPLTVFDITAALRRLFQPWPRRIQPRAFASTDSRKLLQVLSLCSNTGPQHFSVIPRIVLSVVKVLVTGHQFIAPNTLAGPR